MTNAPPVYKKSWLACDCISTNHNSPVKQILINEQFCSQYFHIEVCLNDSERKRLKISRKVVVCTHSSTLFWDQESICLHSKNNNLDETCYVIAKNLINWFRNPIKPPIQQPLVWKSHLTPTHKAACLVYQTLPTGKVCCRLTAAHCHTCSMQGWV